MMLTVMKNTKSPVKFWFLKNYLSPTFQVLKATENFFYQTEKNLMFLKRDFCCGNHVSPLGSPSPGETLAGKYSARTFPNLPLYLFCDHRKRISDHV